MSRAPASVGRHHASLAEDARSLFPLTYPYTDGLSASGVSALCGTRTASQRPTPEAQCSGTRYCSESDMWPSPTSDRMYGSEQRAAFGVAERNQAQAEARGGSTGIRLPVHSLHTDSSTLSAPLRATLTPSISLNDEPHRSTHSTAFQWNASVICVLSAFVSRAACSAPERSGVDPAGRRVWSVLESDGVGYQSWPGSLELLSTHSSLDRSVPGGKRTAERLCAPQNYCSIWLSGTIRLCIPSVSCQTRASNTRLRPRAQRK